jgi:hypothetical protein
MAGKAELLTGIEDVSSRPVHRIVLREGGEKRPLYPALTARDAASTSMKPLLSTSSPGRFLFSG